MKTKHTFSERIKDWRKFVFNKCFVILNLNYAMRFRLKNSEKNIFKNVNLILKLTYIPQNCISLYIFKKTVISPLHTLFYTQKTKKHEKSIVKFPKIMHLCRKTVQD